VLPLDKVEEGVWRLINGRLDYQINFETNIVELKKAYFSGKKNNEVLNIFDRMLDMIEKMYETSIKYNIGFYDLHEGNFGKTKDGEYKFFDIRSDKKLDKNLKLKPIICKL